MKENRINELILSATRSMEQQQRGGGGGERRCCKADLRWAVELLRFKNEEGRRKEGDKGHVGLIPGERRREACMKGGVGSCLPASVAHGGAPRIGPCPVL
jgi:hypothetical protein